MAGQGMTESIKSRLLYHILKEFQSHMENGNFDAVDKNEIFELLVEKGIMAEDQSNLFNRTITAMTSTSICHNPRISDKHNRLLEVVTSPKHRLTDCGHLVCMSWEKDFSDEISFEINHEDPDIEIRTTCRIFISCGSRDRERPLGDFLDKTLESAGCETFWWGKGNPSQADRTEAWERFHGEIMDCEYFVAMLHRRERLGVQKYHSSNAVRDEICWAIAEDKPMSIFKENDVVMDGLILPRRPYRSVSNSTDLLHFLQSDIKKIQPE
jgi:hypothetical protein